ncbi:MAG: ABC transporter permease [Spirochaetia bacterium]|jgi:simple sugar transport system permease protein|nr:ABC transporter permease [Spirochaetia bacterium]
MNTLIFIQNLLAATLAMGTSLTYTTLGEVFTEKSGILNLGLEGTMLFGALCGFATAYHTGSLLLGLLMAMAAGVLLAAIHSFLSITLRANQVVTGLAITMFGSGLANFLGKRLGPVSNDLNLVGMSLKATFDNLAIPGLSKVPILGAFFNVSILTYIMYLLLPLAWYLMYKTRYGLTIRAVGENPMTAAAMGISVTKVRYLYTLIGGAMAGLGGACLSLSFTPSWNDNMTGGMGWIAIALVIFSGWNPGRVAIGTLVFGGITSLQFAIQAAGLQIGHTGAVIGYHSLFHHTAGPHCHDHQQSEARQQLCCTFCIGHILCN